MIPFVALLLSYLIGSIPTGYWLLKLAKGVDIRTMGSGNIGATNALRTAGPGIGITVLLLDMAKGAVASAVVASLVPNASLTTRLACGTAAVLGHSYSCLLGFSGGKGVATTLGALLGCTPPVAGIAIATFLVIFGITRYVSIASLCAAASIPIGVWRLHHPAPNLLLGIALAALITVRHRANIERLLQGTEHRAWSGQSRADA